MVLPACNEEIMLHNFPSKNICRTEKVCWFFWWMEQVNSFVNIRTEPMIISRDEISLLLKREEKMNRQLSIFPLPWIIDFNRLLVFGKLMALLRMINYGVFFGIDTKLQIKRNFYSNKYALVMHNKFRRSIQTFLFHCRENDKFWMIMNVKIALPSYRWWWLLNDFQLLMSIAHGDEERRQ